MSADVAGRMSGLEISGDKNPSKEEEEEAATLSLIREDDKFVCGLGRECLHGNSRLRDAGKLYALDHYQVTW